MNESLRCCLSTDVQQLDRLANGECSHPAAAAVTVTRRAAILLGALSPLTCRDARGGVVGHDTMLHAVEQSVALTMLPASGEAVVDCNGVGKDCAVRIGINHISRYPLRC